jgi:hypothetical protein
MTKVDLSHCGHQHIWLVSGRNYKDNAPCCMLLSRRSGRFPALLYPPRQQWHYAWIYCCLKALKPKDLSYNTY